MNATRISAFALILLLAGCASTDYVGKSYPATTNVDVFFSTDDIEQDYEVMGQAKTEGGEYMSFEAVQKQLVKDAMARGADAILIEGMDEVVVATTSTTDGSSKDKTKYETDKDGNVKKETGQVGYTEVTTTTDIKDKVITAKLLKYKG